MAGERECILFFAEYPEASRMKIELADEIGDHNTAILHRCFLQDINKLLGSMKRDVFVYCSPSDDVSRVKELLGLEARFFPQIGESFGERLENAFRDVFSWGYARAVAITSDVPDLTESYFADAFDSIGYSQAVIGPAGNGGYCLLGFRADSFLPDLFQDVARNSDLTLAWITAKLNAAGYLVGRLPEWPSASSVSDLRRLFSENRTGHFSKSMTMAFLAALPEIRGE